MPGLVQTHMDNYIVNPVARKLISAYGSSMSKKGANTFRDRSQNPNQMCMKSAAEGLEYIDVIKN